MIKKKVLIHSNYPGAPTGFGGFMRELLCYLYKLNKYEITMYAGGMPWETPEFQRFPWKTYGSLPNNPQEMEIINRDPMQARNAAYGAHYIDRVINLVKPDVYIAVEDYWGFSYVIDKPWFQKINSIICWTADSLPLLQESIDKASKTKHHYVWADFATKEFHRLGITNVKTLRGSVDTNTYKKLSNLYRSKLRIKHNIPEDAYCIGTLSRNQLRKLFPNLIAGYRLFKDQNPEIKNTRLLFYTSFSEGWDIPRLIKEYGLNPEEVLACYKCRATGEYFVMPFRGQDLDNPNSGYQKTLVTVNTQDKLPAEQVNEWYNLLDVFCLPITSGGQERAVQEAKLCEIITLMNPYSCGEDNCVPEAYSLSLDFSTYREIGTQFIKASVYPQSIAKQLKKVYEMPPEKRKEWGKLARKWVLENFSIEVIGKQYENLIDSMPNHDYDFNEKTELKDPDAIIENLPENSDFIEQLYNKILKVPSDPQGKNYWLNLLQNGAKRDQLVQQFRSIAASDNQKIGATNNKFEDTLDNTGRKRFLIVASQSIGDLLYATSLLDSFKESYSSYDIYLACDPQYAEIFEGNKNLYKIIPYNPIMENEIAMTGAGENKGFFDGYCHLFAGSQRVLNYLTNNKIALKLK